MSGLAFALLADGRFPAGGHVHSAGVEAAVADGRITGIADLEHYVRGRLHTTGRTEAAFAAATVERLAEADGPPPTGLWTVAVDHPPQPSRTRDVLVALDAEVDARIAPPTLREASRRLGRQLVRAAAGCWPSALLAQLVTTFPGGTHQPVALGAVATSAGLDVLDAARLALHHSAGTPLQAAVRLLGIDPFAVVALAARLAEEAEPVAVEAAALATGPLRDLPSATGPVVDIAAGAHATSDRALFAT